VREELGRDRGARPRDERLIGRQGRVQLSRGWLAKLVDLEPPVAEVAEALGGDGVDDQDTHGQPWIA